MTRKQLTQLLLIEALFVVFLAGIHYLLLQSVLPAIYNDFRVVYIYLFLSFMSLIGIVGIYFIQKNDSTMIGKGFMVFIMVKLFASLAFLLPFLLNQDETTRPFVYQFFGVFFPILLVETILILQIVKYVELQNSEKKE